MDVKEEVQVAESRSMRISARDIDHVTMYCLCRSHVAMYSFRASEGSDSLFNLLVGLLVLAGYDLVFCVYNTCCQSLV